MIHPWCNNLLKCVCFCQLWLEVLWVWMKFWCYSHTFFPCELSSSIDETFNSGTLGNVHCFLCLPFVSISRPLKCHKHELLQSLRHRSAKAIVFVVSSGDYNEKTVHICRGWVGVRMIRLEGKCHFTVKTTDMQRDFSFVLFWQPQVKEQACLFGDWGGDGGVAIFLDSHVISWERQEVR